MSLIEISSSLFPSPRAFLEFARPVASRSTPMGISLPVLDSVYLALQLGRRRLKPSLCLIDKKSSSSRQPLPSARNNGDEEGDCDGDIIPQLKLPDSGTHQIFVTSVRKKYFSKNNFQNFSSRLSTLVISGPSTVTSKPTSN